MPQDPAPPAECAQCGADIPPRAHACPGCGADERTGWREQSVYDGLNLPDEDTDNDYTIDDKVTAHIIIFSVFQGAPSCVGAEGL